MREHSIDVNGACLCGQVRYRASLRPGTGACHCGSCRKWSGGPLMSVHAIGKVAFSGEEFISRYRSSEWAQRGFCSQCGSNLFYHLLPRPGLPDGEYILSAGSVENQSIMNFDHEVYVDNNPGWYSFSGESTRKQLTEGDILAMYGPDSDTGENN